MAYQPAPVPAFTSFNEVTRFLEEEFRAVSRELLDTQALELRARYAEPTKRLPGLIVYADGTEWNPGSGEGVYVWTIAGAWAKL
jgi:hypothetical protein